VTILGMFIRAMVKMIGLEEFVTIAENNNAGNEERNNVGDINNEGYESDKSTMMKENCNIKLDIVPKDRLIVSFVRSTWIIGFLKKKGIIIISASQMKKHICKK
jgi:hypothetical protein